jgi:hypothetical protein
LPGAPAPDCVLQLRSACCYCVCCVLLEPVSGCCAEPPLVPDWFMLVVAEELEFPLSLEPDGALGLTLSERDSERLGPAEDVVPFALMSVDVVDPCTPLGEIALRLGRRSEVLVGEVELRFRSMSVELDELDELLGTDALPFRLMSVDEELAPGTTATPGVVSIVVLLVDVAASGALGTQPAGTVFALSMHFGSSWLPGTFTEVTVSARATPNAASSAALMRLMRKNWRFIVLPPGLGFQALDPVWQPDSAAGCAS